MNETDLESFKSIFKSGALVNYPNSSQSMGRGLFEADLFALGYEKKELKKYAHMGIIKKVTTRYKGGWRNTYVMMGLQ